LKKIFCIVILSFIFFSSLRTFAQTPYSGSVNIGANVLLGEFKKVYKSGASVEAGLLYSLPKSGLKLTASVGYSGFKYNSSYFNDLVLSKMDLKVVDFYPDWSATDISLMVGARYKAPSEDITPYISGEVGVHYVNFKDRFNGNKLIGNDTLMTVRFTNTDKCTESKAEIGFGFSIGTGLEIPIVEKVNLDLGLKYRYCGAIFFKSFEVQSRNGSSFITSELKNMSYITIKAGVVVDF
jgi:opacity protein-like surface antigen